MIDPGASLASLTSALERALVPYMVVGSFASSRYGVPRSTNDLDLIIEPTFQTLGDLLDLLSGEDLYFDSDTARSEFSRRGQFNVIDIAASWKADLYFRRSRPFDRVEFERRVPGVLLGVAVFVATAEDTVLAKLEWAKLGPSEQQLRDVHGIIAVQRDALDRAYIENWLDALGVRDLWERVQL